MNNFVGDGASQEEARVTASARAATSTKYRTQGKVSKLAKVNRFFWSFLFFSFFSFFFPVRTGRGTTNCRYNGEYYRR
jgi:hypothetical protein